MFFISCLGLKDEQFRCEKAFSDYKILLKLVRLTDQVFGVVLQSYYGSQVLVLNVLLKFFDIAFCLRLAAEYVLRTLLLGTVGNV